MTRRCEVVGDWRVRMFIAVSVSIMGKEGDLIRFGRVLALCLYTVVSPDSRIPQHNGHCHDEIHHKRFLYHRLPYYPLAFSIHSTVLDRGVA